MCFIHDGSVYISHTIVVASRVSSRDVERVGAQLNWLYSKIVSDTGSHAPVVTSSYALLPADECSVVRVRAALSKLADTTATSFAGRRVWCICIMVHCDVSINFDLLLSANRMVSATVSLRAFHVWHEAPD